jgi:hypothetical protein
MLPLDARDVKRATTKRAAAISSPIFVNIKRGKTKARLCMLQLDFFYVNGGRKSGRASLNLN